MSEGGPKQVTAVFLRELNRSIFMEHSDATGLTERVACLGLWVKELDRLFGYAIRITREIQVAVICHIGKSRWNAHPDAMNVLFLTFQTIRVAQWEAFL